MSRSKDKFIGVTLGDPAGIGPEVIAKALSKPSLYNLAHYKIIGDPQTLKKYFKKRFDNCIFIEVPYPKSQKLTYGCPNKTSGKASLLYLKKAAELLKSNEIHGLVTAPICKEAVALTQKRFVGHTEFLAEAFKVKNPGMMFVAKDMKTILVTRHIPLREASQKLTSKKIYDTIDLANRALKKLFKVKKPKIAVCGLNPHAGEGGTLGKEEITKIIPAIEKAKRAHIGAIGPFAADTLFSPDIGDRYDTIVAMYHDQGLIPIKSLYFNNLVNVTIGLPFIRTSPAHGTAFDLVGKDKANASSMCEAIKLAVCLS